MKKIDIIMAIFKTQQDYSDMLERLYDKGLKGVYEIFTFVQDIKDCSYVLLEYNTFGEYLSDNLEGIFEDSDNDYINFKKHILDMQPELNEIATPVDRASFAVELAKVEGKRFRTYYEWCEDGVTFEIFDKNEDYLENLITEIIGQDIGDILLEVSNGDISDDELFTYFKQLIA